MAEGRTDSRKRSSDLHTGIMARMPQPPQSINQSISWYVETPDAYLSFIPAHLHPICQTSSQLSHENGSKASVGNRQGSEMG